MGGGSGIIIDALGKWGLTAHTSGRNDIVLGPEDKALKISGSSYVLLRLCALAKREVGQRAVNR